jgi:tetratricopeptide (TPR) repeat protein
MSAPQLISCAKSLYRQAETPENSLVIRALLAEALAAPEGVDRPLLAEAWALRAHNLICDYLNHWNNAGRTERETAEAAAHTALELDRSLPYAHYVVGFVYRSRGEHEASLTAFQEALRLKPDYARAHAQAANELTHVGRLKDAVASAGEAIRIGSSDLSLGAFHWIRGRAYFFDDEMVDAASDLNRSVKLKSNVWYNRLYEVSACQFIGEQDRAARALDEFNILFPDFTIAKVVEYETSSPNEHPVLVEGRRKMHKGLAAAGMPDR